MQYINIYKLATDLLVLEENYKIRIEVKSRRLLNSLTILFLVLDDIYGQLVPKCGNIYILTQNITLLDVELSQKKQRSFSKILIQSLLICSFAIIARSLCCDNF